MSLSRNVFICFCLFSFQKNIFLPNKIFLDFEIFCKNIFSKSFFFFGLRNFLSPEFFSKSKIFFYVQAKFVRQKYINTIGCSCMLCIVYEYVRIKLSNRSYSNSYKKGNPNQFKLHVNYFIYSSIREHNL